jgi:periplasmic divalent cation tolerance protein
VKPTTGVAVVFMTAPDEAKAVEIARTLVEERMIACANIVPAVRSIYRWEGKIADEREVLVVMKITSEDFKAIEARVKVLHPAQVPELIKLEVSDGLPAYLQWVLASGG